MKTDKTIIGIAKQAMKVDLPPGDIDRSHRLPGGGGGALRPGVKAPRNLIIKITKYNARRTIYEKRKSLKGYKDRIFVNEHLTKNRSELYYETRQLHKKGKIKQTWTQDGRILIRNNDDRVQQILSRINLQLYDRVMPGWTPAMH